MADIITLTMNPAVDKSAYVERVIPERKLRCGPPEYDPGGGGVNVARMIQRLGGAVEAVCAAGGLNGRHLADLLQREHVAPRIIPIQGETRQNLAVYDRSAQHQFRFGMPGPRLHEAEWRKCLAAAFESDPKPRFLVASGSLPPGVPDDFYARLARRAEEEGIRCIVDCAGEPLRLAVAQGVYLIKPNLREFHAMIGEDIEGERLEERVKALIDAGRSQVIVVSLGSAGVLAGWPGVVRTFAAPTVKIESKVGAGDSALAGVIVGLSRGYDLPNAVRLGLASGAAAVMTPGSQLARPEDTQRLFDMLRAAPKRRAADELRNP